MAEIEVLDSEPVSAHVIETLQEALDEARSGSISSVAIACVRRDGCVGNAWSKAPRMSALIGSVARLQYAMIEALDG
jgi:hypothetical protein